MNFGWRTSHTWHFALRTVFLSPLQGIKWKSLYILKIRPCFKKIFIKYSSEVAKGLKQESYGLVFGINTFLALFFQTILTLIVADSAGLALEPTDQVTWCILEFSIKAVVKKKNWFFFSLKCMEATMWSWVLCFFPWLPTTPAVEVIKALKDFASQDGDLFLNPVPIQW